MCFYDPISASPRQYWFDRGIELSTAISCIGALLLISSVFSRSLGAFTSGKNIHNYFLINRIALGTTAIGFIGIVSLACLSTNGK